MSLPPPPVRPLTNDAALYDWLYALYSYVVGADAGMTIGTDGVSTSNTAAFAAIHAAMSEAQATALLAASATDRDKSKDSLLLANRRPVRDLGHEWLMTPPRAIPRFMSIRVLSASSTIAPGEFADVDATSADVTITLPPAATNSGKMIGVAKSDASANFVTLSGQVNGAATTDLTTQYTALLLISNGTEWRAW